ncbi:MAG: ATP phosphoribosyltransferase regulatory subunit [Eubacterium sp.]|nr:ATP phosphoribosyltransferase regulatory subunit [Eubacterium sp.]
MKNELLHTPDGVRDIFGNESAVKRKIENSISGVFESFGYNNVQTPTFEYFDVFSEKRGSVPSKDLYKFFDRAGNTLVLRPDITPSIARLVAKNYKDETKPIKLCYNGDTFINNSELQGKLKEITQLGCELINDDSIDADAEMIALVVESLKATGLEDFMVEICEVDFYKGLISECGFDKKTEHAIRRAIIDKKNFEVESILEEQKVPSNVKDALLNLTELFGSVEVLDKALELTDNELSVKSINRLKELYSILEEYGVAKYISFDLGMISNFTYYTGIIFKAYTYGSGDEIVAGGRYDNLIGQFDKDAAAIGFAIYVDQIASVIYSKNPSFADEAKCVIVYSNEKRKEAIECAMSKRAEGNKAILVKDTQAKDFGDQVEIIEFK